MKKNFLLFLSSFFLFAFSVHAQFKLLGQGPVFDEPKDGYAKILQFKNGNTLFVWLEKKEGIDVQVYNSVFKQISTQRIMPKLGDFENIEMNAFFKVSDDAILFITKFDDKALSLYRLIIDSKTGHLKREEKLAEYAGISRKDFIIDRGKITTPGFFVRNDPENETYAIASLGELDKKNKRSIELQFYDSQHKLVSTGKIDYDPGKSHFLNYIDMAITGKEKVSLVACTYFHNRFRLNDPKIILATLDIASSELTTSELTFRVPIRIDWGLLRYNPMTKKLLLLSATFDEENHGGYIPFIASIDPYEKTMISTSVVFPSKANDKCLEIFGNKKPFRGMPQNLYINRDGSITIVFEEMKSFIGQSEVSSSTELGNLAVMTLNEENKEMNNYFIPKSQALEGGHLEPFYLSMRQDAAQKLAFGSQYKSFAYINGLDKSFILFNDIERNIEMIHKGKITEIIGVGECDGFYFNLNGNNILPDRKFISPNTNADSKEHFPFIFIVSDYNRENNILATLQLDSKKDKLVKMVWMQPQ